MSEILFANLFLTLRCNSSNCFWLLSCHHERMRLQLWQFQCYWNMVLKIHEAAYCNTRSYLMWSNAWLISQFNFFFTKDVVTIQNSTWAYSAICFLELDYSENISSVELYAFKNFEWKLLSSECSEFRVTAVIYGITLRNRISF